MKTNRILLLSPVIVLTSVVLIFFCILALACTLIAPVSSHNYEHANRQEKFPTAARKIGVNVLENEFAHIEHDDGKVTIFGLDDPFRFENDESEKERVDEIFSENQIENGFNILLAHRPELYEVYEKHGFDLVFRPCSRRTDAYSLCWRSYCTTSRIFPKYSEGLHEFESMK